MGQDAAKQVILVVDDDAAIAEVLKDALSDEPGYQAVAVGDATQALAVLQQVRVHLILLDLNLPGIDGATFYDRLQDDDTLRTIPVLFLTASWKDGRLRERGVPHVMSKPFDLNVLLARVAELLTGEAG